MTILAAALLTIVALNDPAIEWQIETDGMAHSPTLFPNTATPTGVLVAAGKQLLLIDGSGTTRWTMSFEQPIATSATVAGLDGDGNVECVALLTNGELVCVNADGSERWSRASDARAGVYNLVVAADVHPFPGCELIYGLDGGWLRCLSAQGEPLWRFFGDRFRVGPPAAADTDGDGCPEIVYGTDNGNIYCLDGLGRIEWRFTDGGPYGRSGMNVADLDTDGRPEILFTRSNAGIDHCLTALDAATGGLKWRSPAEMQAYVSNAIIDIDGDGHLESLHADKGNWLYCVNADGRERWRVHLAGRGIFWAPAAGDLDGDGRNEVLIGVRDTDPVRRASHFVVSSDGRILASLTLGSSGNGAPAMGDIDGDGEIEAIVVASGPNTVQSLTWHGKGNVSWPCLRGDSAQTGGNGIPAVKPQPPQRYSPPQEITIENNRVYWGDNEFPVSWPTPAPENAFTELTVVPRSGEARTTVLSVASGATSTLLPCSIAAKKSRASVRLWASGGLQPIAAGERTIRTERPDACGLDTVRDAVARATVAGTRNADAAGLQSQCMAIEAEAAALRNTSPEEQPDEVAARATSLRHRSEYLVRVANIASDRWANGDAGSFIAWQDTNPWDTLAPNSLPETPSATPALHIRLFGGEREDVALNLLNLSSRAVTVRCVFQKPDSVQSRAAKEPDLARAFTLRQGLQVPENQSSMVLDALPELGPSRTITLPPFETQQLWLVADAHGLEPGTHALALYIGSLEPSSTVREVPITIEVLPIELPQGVYAQMNWVGVDVQDTSPQQLQDMLDHGITVAYGPAMPSVSLDAQGNVAADIDWARFDAGLARLPDYMQLLWGGPPPIAWPKGVEAQQGSALFERGFATSLHVLVKHLAENGFGYERWAFYPFDEPWLTGFTVVPMLREFAERVKRIDSSVRVYANPAGYVRPEFLDEFKALIDVWQPEINMLKRDPALLDWFHANAETLWAYEATDPGKSLLPLGYYRSLAWLAWKLGLDGAGFWVYKYDDLYWPLERPHWSVVYPTNDQVVPSRRWEAVRDGQEDYRLLAAFKGEIARIRAAGHDDDARSAEALLNEAVQNIAGWQVGQIDEITRQTRDYEVDFDLLNTCRDQIAEEIIRLRKIR